MEKNHVNNNHYFVQLKKVYVYNDQMKLQQLMMLVVVIMMMIMTVIITLRTKPSQLITLHFRHVWEKDGSVINVQSIPRIRLDADGTLHISQTWSGDIGTYTCRVTSVGGNDSRSAHLRVR